MDDKNFYSRLGVAYNASEGEIRKAYHRLALKYHPDHNPNDKQAEEKFKEINEAYQVLSESQKRARYDQMSGIYTQTQNKPNAATDGFSDFFNSSYWGPAPSSASDFRARRTPRRKTQRPKSSLKMHEFVIQELVNMSTIDSITYALCENYGITWQDAKSLINNIRIEQAKLITLRQVPWVVPVAFSMLIGGMLSTIFGAYIIVFVATIPVRGAGNLAALLLPQILTQIPAILGYAWLAIATGLGLMIGSLRSMKDAWLVLSDHFERRNQG